MDFRQRVTGNKLFDYILGQLFIFWKWLGNKLGVEIKVDAPRVVVHEKPVLVAPKGVDRPNRKKLTDREVALIRDMHRAGTAQIDIAYAFDVNPATISRIVRGQYHRSAA